MSVAPHRRPGEDAAATMPGAPSRRTSAAAWLVLLVLAAAAWAVTVAQTAGMRSMPDMPGMAAAPSPFLLFLLVWIGMMVAMMFPSIAPMVMLFMAVSRSRRRAGRHPAPTWVFLLGYLAIWSCFGVAAYLLSLIVPAVSMAAPGVRAASPLVGGLILIFAGLYQWSPLKRVCLQHCRSPLGFLAHAWRDGYAGAFRLGAAHGAYCVGCCWGLMVVLFAVGLMNLVWMALLAAVIFAEKVVPYGPVVGKLAGLGILVSGLALLATPWTARMPM